MGIAWSIWIACSVVSFAALEAWGYLHFGTTGTLTAYVRAWSAAHTAVPYSLCALGAVLAYHFWGTA